MLQEHFDTVWQHFVVERGPKSATLDKNGLSVRCLYKGLNGARCAPSVTPSAPPSRESRRWTVVSEATKRALRDAISNAEDNAYRYRRLGGRPSDIAYAKEIERNIEAMRADLAKMEVDRG